MILADWTSQDWSYAKTKAVIYRLSQLIQDGFEIYIWQSDGNGFDQVTRLNELHLTDLFDRETRRKITLTDEAVILDTASKKLPRSTLCLLDDYGISQLLQDTDEDIPRELPVEALSHIGIEDPARFGGMMMPTDEGTEEQEKTLSLLRNQSPHYNVLVSRDAGNRDTHYFHSLFPGLVADSKNESITVYDVDKLKTITSTTAQNITCANISSKSRDYPAIFERLDHLEEICTYDSEPDLGLLFQHAPPTLKYLGLANVERISDVTVKLFSREQLEVVSIEGLKNTSGNFVETILFSAPNLRKLALPYCCYNSSFTLTKLIPVMTHLEELVLGLGGEAGKRTILSASPNLRKLKIDVDDFQTLDAIVNKESLEVLQLNCKRSTNHSLSLI